MATFGGRAPLHLHGVDPHSALRFIAKASSASVLSTGESYAILEGEVDRAAPEEAIEAVAKAAGWSVLKVPGLSDRGKKPLYVVGPQDLVARAGQARAGTDAAPFAHYSAASMALHEVFQHLGDAAGVKLEGSAQGKIWLAGRNISQTGLSGLLLELSGGSASEDGKAWNLTQAALPSPAAFPMGSCPDRSHVFRGLDVTRDLNRVAILALAPEAMLDGRKLTASALVELYYMRCELEPRVHFGVPPTDDGQTRWRVSAISSEGFELSWPGGTATLTVDSASAGTPKELLRIQTEQAQPSR